MKLGVNLEVNLAVDFMWVYKESSLKMWRHLYQFLQDTIIFRDEMFFCYGNVHLSPVLVWIYNTKLIRISSTWLSRHNFGYWQKQLLRGVLIKRCSNLPMPKCDFNKVAKQLYWNRTSAWLFSCKLAAYFQNTFY